ncbi:MAG: hypothetical protein RL885_19685 [Planctomycetota bacterium]
MPGSADRLARTLPGPLAELATSAREWARAMLREGPAFRAVGEELAATERFSAEQLTDWQWQKLEQAVRHAYARTVYYRELFDSLGITPEDIRSAEDFARLPIVTKDDILERPRDFRASGGHGLIVLEDGTSGTSGRPLRVPRDLRSIVFEHAHLHRQLLWAGWKPGQRRAWLRGDSFLPIDRDRPPFWHRVLGRAMLKLSSYHLKEAHLAGCLDALRRFGPTILQAYPSSAAWLARGLLARGDDPIRMNGVVTSSETLRADQKRDIERAFACRVFDWYGTFERVAAIGTCERGGRHLISDYAYGELIPDPETDSLRIIGTSWSNRVFPVLRYDAGDRVAPAKEPCDCGRAFPTTGEVLGRQDDVVVTRDGRSVGRLDHVFKEARGIREAQIVQERAGEVVIRFVPDGEGARAGEALLRAARERLGSSTRVSVQPVERLERGPRGKLQLVVSKLDPPERNGALAPKEVSR